MRIEDFCLRYMAGEPFESCLRPMDPNFLRLIKSGEFELDFARKMANAYMRVMDNLLERAKEMYKDVLTDQEAVELLDDVQYRIMKLAMMVELKEED